jgi:1,6-anhydro-N-acetylmuramate kinase
MQMRWLSTGIVCGGACPNTVLRGVLAQMAAELTLAQVALAADFRCSRLAATSTSTIAKNWKQDANGFRLERAKGGPKKENYSNSRSQKEW